jgi:hypothetical protein
VRARALTGGWTGDFLLDSRYPNLVYKAHNFPIASGTIVASPTGLSAGAWIVSRDRVRHCSALFFIVSGSGEWARRGLMLHLRGSLIHHAAQGVIERTSTAARSWAGVRPHC